MTDELKYDPELPYAFVGNGKVFARFADLNTAKAHRLYVTVGEVIDTTPKPKIPEGAEFICWSDGSGRSVAIWENFNPTKPWDFNGVYYSEEKLLEDEIGDAEVTVLVRKEAS